MNTWKPNLEETKRRYIDWWNHRGIILNMWEHFQEGVRPHADVAEPAPPKNLNQQWFDPEWRAEYLDWYVAHSSLMADILPVANTQLGPGSLAAILGGVFEAGEDTIWIHPNPDFSDDIVFYPEHPNYLLHKKLLQACKQKAQGHYYVGMPDLMEGLDVLAALKGTDQVLLDTVMQPEVLERQMQQINDIYFRVFDELYDIIREGDEMAFCYFSCWAPGKMTKLQSDISTMISEDDYRRFVQPFIREQCQKIDYTLYHLDGVGAMHHLPALLEIEELNAIQWTPGVGQPQGGSPKWYDLYRRILEGGKSVMACWVTLDELRPLLDNIGGEGVHIEMDFHNEREVEQALRIVEEYQSKEPINREEEHIIPLTSHLSPLTSSPTSLSEQARRKPLILDGAMGTMIQQYALTENDFRGTRFAQHPQELKGCNDVLALTSPNIIRDIHRKYLEAGADIIETNTFNAQRISMEAYGLQDCCRDINLAACRIAREEADAFTGQNPEKPRFVAGSIGPTSQTFLTAGGEGMREWFASAYREQVEALIDGGVDALLIETIFDTQVAETAISAALSVMLAKGRRLPLMLSFSIATPDGHNMLGQSIPDFITSLDNFAAQTGSRAEDIFFSVGFNCLSDVPLMEPLIRRLAATVPYRISLYPNAGLPDAGGHYATKPDDFVRTLWPLLDSHALNIVGGCCGTTDAHIRQLAAIVEPLPSLFLSPRTFSPEAIPSAPDVSSSGAEELPSDSDRPLFTAIVNGHADDADEATRRAIADGVSPQSLMNTEMIAAMTEVGRRFQEGKAFVPQLLMSGRAMKVALAVLQPLLAGSAATTLGKVVIGTVKGDLHDIGKNLVASMLEGCGFEVINIGIDVSADRFIEEVKRHEPDILCMSALLTTTMGYMRDVIEALQRAGIRDRVKVMVGGAPVTQRFADEIGADGYSDNANSAVTIAKQLLEKT